MEPNENNMWDEFGENLKPANSLANLNTNTKIGELLRNQEVEQKRQASERRRIAKLPDCPTCGGKIPKRGVEVCTHCQKKLSWVDVPNAKTGISMMVVCKPGEEQATKQRYLKARQEKFARQQEQNSAKLKRERKQQIKQEKTVADKKANQKAWKKECQEIDLHNAPLKARLADLEGKQGQLITVCKITVGIAFCMYLLLLLGVMTASVFVLPFLPLAVWAIYKKSLSPITQMFTVPLELIRDKSDQLLGTVEYRETANRLKQYPPSPE
ncbi:MAG: hypothetical protein MK108_15460 [Mariniblastus sp.]|nr:hypothetical protein [Mariniblastus sp.]